jgi:hypothetical protein
MLRILARHGLVRIIGGRAVPALLIWDLVVLADRTRRIPVVDRGLRRGAGVASHRIGSLARGRSWPRRDHGR